MAIDDATVPGTDSWWMVQAWKQLRAKHKRLTRLENYRRGTPHITMGTEATATMFYRFQRQCRTNVADLVVQARVERMRIRAVRTAASGDDDGDDTATRLLQASGLQSNQSQFFRMLTTFGEAYLLTCEPAPDSDFSQIIPRSPIEAITLHDGYGHSVAGFELYHDDLAEVDYAILYRPGRKVVAFRKRKISPIAYYPDGRLMEPRISFSPGSFEIRPQMPEAVDDDETAAGWDPTDALLWSEEYDDQEIPLERVLAPGGVGVFEEHTDLIDQINHIYLQGLVIATLQAFKQRAIELEGELPEYDEQGNKINYSDVFAADPGALWKLPKGSKIWESGEVNLDGILNLGKNALQRFAAVTRTPFTMFSADAVNQSAEGAQLTREGLVFHVEDLHAAVDLPMLRAISRALRYMPDAKRYAEITPSPATEGGAAPARVERADRADLAGMSIDWSPAERYSLQEKATADSQALSLPRRQRLRVIWGFTPQEIDQAMAQASEDELTAPLPLSKTAQKEQEFTGSTTPPTDPTQPPAPTPPPKPTPPNGPPPVTGS